MFAKTNRKKNSARQYSGIGDLAAYVLSPSKKKSAVHVEEIQCASLGTRTTCESESADEHLASPVQKQSRTVRTGDTSSFWVSSHDNFYLEKGAAMKGYRVLSYRKMKKGGKRIIFDIVDGKPYYCGVGAQRRITDNAVVFATREEALSERFPSNQFEATKSGNGKHPRVLVAFDCWGLVRARRGGLPSLLCEQVRFTKIVEYLDPPHPRVTRLVKRNVVPYMFPGPDTTPPTRETTAREVKIYRMFNLKKRVASLTRSSSGGTTPQAAKE